MRKVLNTFVLLFLTAGFLYSQSDIGPDTKINVPGNHGISPMEKNQQKIENPAPVVPDGLMQQYYEARRNKNENEKARLGQEIDKYLNAFPTVSNGDAKIVKPPYTPMSPDWGIGDIKVHDGNIANYNGFRQMDMKLGEDGNLYLAVNRRSLPGYNGYISVYTSTNGGRNWSWVSGTASVAYYFGEITMLVEQRSNTNIGDSTRIILYYTVSSASSLDSASLYYCTFLRTGSTTAGIWYSGLVASPSQGNKFQYPSACSDGMYYGSATYLHVVAQEVTNAGVQYRLHHFRSTTWCLTHSDGIINTVNDDYYPSAAYNETITGADSIYVALERRFGSYTIGLRVLSTSEIPSTTFFTYYLAYSLNAKYEKPCITVQQEQYSTPRKVLVTSTKDTAGLKNAKYHTSTNGGASWTIDWALGYVNQMCDFTWCNSDSTTAGGGYFIAGYVNIIGDSISVRRGIIGNMGTILYKRNSYFGTGVLPPLVAIYKDGSTKYSALAYAGTGPMNVYFNSEFLPNVGVTPIGNNIPDKFELNQNYPNPFNPTTNIRFNIPSNEMVKLTVYDILGREVSVLVNEFKNAGSYQVDFNASAFTSGIYFYKIEAGNFTDIKKMILVK